jgi:hypothetical protein
MLKPPVGPQRGGIQLWNGFILREWRIFFNPPNVLWATFRIRRYSKGRKEEKEPEEMRRLAWLLIVLLVGLAACQKDSGGAEAGAVNNAAAVYALELEKSPANLGQLKMNLNQLGPFHGRFILSFDGQTQWAYQVDTRSDGSTIEYSLAVEGVSRNIDLGDIRLISTGGHNYMTGPGTGDVCVQFPDSFETEPLFLGPPEFIHLKEFINLPKESGSDPLLGRDAVRYTSSEGSHLGWKDVSVSFWMDTQTEAVLKYEFFAQGNDPLYYQGDGKLHGVFEVIEIGPQQIDGIPDCSINFPLPPDAAGLIHFPGLISYITAFDPASLDSFYTQALGPAGWVREEPQINPQTQDSVLEYSSQSGSILIRIAALTLQDGSQGYKVEIYLDE